MTERYFLGRDTYIHNKYLEMLITSKDREMKQPV
jgi:hypothetical protein